MQSCFARAARNPSRIADPLRLGYGRESPRRSSLVSPFFRQEDEEEEGEAAAAAEEEEDEDRRTRSALLRGDLFRIAHTFSEALVAHHHLVKHGLEKDAFLCGLLVRLYNVSGASDHAMAAFDRAAPDPLPAWNSFIRAYASRGSLAECLQVLAQLQEQCVLADKFSFIPIVLLCGRRGFLQQGKRIHASVARGSEQETDVALGTSLISMYGKCGSFDAAKQKLYGMRTCNEVPWTALVSCYAQRKMFGEAMDLFAEMLEEGGKPNKVTFVCILDVFAARSGIHGGRLMHACIAESGFEADANLGVALLSMYSRCGSLGDARAACDKMKAKTAILWNAMICAYASNREAEGAFRCFHRLAQEGSAPNKTTFICILDACVAEPECLRRGKRVHSRAVELGYDSDPKLGTALINMYGRCGALGDARKAYSKLSEWDVVALTSMIGACSERGRFQEAIRFFVEMLQRGIEPNQVTFVCILDACSSCMGAPDCRRMHAFAVEDGHGRNGIVGNALISMYGKLACPDDALDLFESLGERTVVSWTTMICVEAQRGRLRDALALFGRMQARGVPPNAVTFASMLDACAIEAAAEAGRVIHMLALDLDLQSEGAVASALVDMYGKCGSLEDARVMFARASERKEPLWASMIAVHGQRGEYERMRKLFDEMEERGMKPSAATYISLLEACWSHSDGERLHSHLVASGWNKDDDDDDADDGGGGVDVDAGGGVDVDAGDCDVDASIATALMNMYGRCGNVYAAEWMFKQLIDPNVVSWTSMIALYGQHGRGQDALRLFQNHGIVPNKVTYAALLDACNHEGLVEEAMECLAQAGAVSDAVVLDADHCVCIVDLIGRLGCLREAECLIHRMPFQPNQVILTVILGACRLHGCIRDAERMANFILELDPDNAAAFVMLSNIYASRAHPPTSI